ncbi:MAG: 4Fe-4S binding protein [Spirochaetales bacterium]|nr:4Fe-4S binding protein [Spirochaetales bacterium]
MGCGAAVVDEYLCVGCGACTQKCRFVAVSLVRNNDAKGLVLTGKDLPPLRAG